MDQRLHGCLGGFGKKVVAIPDPPGRRYKKYLTR
jgi:hypothetical protein